MPALEHDNLILSDGFVDKIIVLYIFSFVRKMSKLAVFFMMISILAVQGVPQSPFDDIIKAANAGQWESLQSLLVSKFGKDGWQPVTLGSVRSLKPVEGGHVYGESEYTFHSSSGLNGQKNEQSAGHKIINKDGDVKEFDFKPKFEQNPLFKLS